MLFDPDSPAATLANLLEHETLARLGIVLELALVGAQALCALWFYRLFRHLDSFAAGSLAAFGLFNAVAILGSAACLGAALGLALASPSADVASADGAASAQLLYVLGGNFWGVGALFFGLWLIPMGVLALRSGMPRALGWILMAGGVGYVLNGFAAYLAPAAESLTALLVIPATVGELWMIGWLLWHSFRSRARITATTATAAAVTP